MPHHHPQQRFVPLINSHNDFPEQQQQQQLENQFNGENNYEDNYEDEDYPAGQTTEAPTTDSAILNPDRTHDFIDAEDHATLYTPNNPLPPSQEEPSWTPYNPDEPLVEPEIQRSESRVLGNIPSYETQEEPSESVSEDFNNVTPNPVDPQRSDVYRSNRFYGNEEVGGLDTDGKTSMKIIVPFCGVKVAKDRHMFTSLRVTDRGHLSRVCSV